MAHGYRPVRPRDEVAAAVMATAARMLADRTAAGGATGAWVTASEIAADLGYDRLEILQILTVAWEHEQVTLRRETLGEFVVTAVGPALAGEQSWEMTAQQPDPDLDAPRTSG